MYLKFKHRFYRYGISLCLYVQTSWCGGHKAMTCIIDLIPVEHKFAAGKWENSGHLELNNNCCSDTDLSAVTFCSTVQERRSFKLFLFPLENVWNTKEAFMKVQLVSEFLLKTTVLKIDFCFSETKKLIEI